MFFKWNAEKKQNFSIIKVLLNFHQKKMRSKQLAKSLNPQAFGIEVSTAHEENALIYPNP